MRRQDDNIKKMLASRAPKEMELIPIYVSGLEYIDVMTDDDMAKGMTDAKGAANALEITVGELYDLVNEGQLSPRQHKDNASLHFFFNDLSDYAMRQIESSGGPGVLTKLTKDDINKSGDK